ncbi:MAG TPA: sulfite exporter TauE/SafE family protein [Candidatus Binataceae bacterium]|nr:sulfite exporter TauE/SafE family protein [Candidatus Binataceae bacterium]
MQTIIVLTIGIVAGVLGGFFGLAGGIVIVPALVFVLSMPTQTAVGTSLAALLPPVGLLGAMEYYKHGNVNFVYAMLLAAGLMAGAYFGAILAVRMSEEMLRRAFAIFLALLAVRLFIR